MHYEMHMYMYMYMYLHACNVHYLTCNPLVSNLFLPLNGIIIHEYETQYLPIMVQQDCIIHVHCTCCL